jgi:hypothetical protein
MWSEIKGIIRVISLNLIKKIELYNTIKNQLSLN